MQMRETARASILSLRNTGGGRESDESQTPILHSAGPKASGLRHHLAEDGSSEFDEGLMMSKDGRF